MLYILSAGCLSTCGTVHTFLPFKHVRLLLAKRYGTKLRPHLVVGQEKTREINPLGDILLCSQDPSHHVGEVPTALGAQMATRGREESPTDNTQT